jgi:Fe-S oxidoreductase
MIDDCNECGICKSACPMYRIMLKESQSPRGMLIIESKEIKTPLVFNCANCLACKEACPSKVDFSIERIRQKIIRESEIEAARKILENIQKYNNPYGADETDKQP